MAVTIHKAAGHAAAGLVCMADHQRGTSAVAGQQPVPAMAMDGDQPIRQLHAGMPSNGDGQQQQARPSGPLRGRQQPGQQSSGQEQYQPGLRPTGEQLSGGQLMIQFTSTINAPASCFTGQHSS